VNIDWATLGEITGVATAVALTVVLLVAVALVGSSAHSGRRVHAPDVGRAALTHSAAGMAVAVLCVLAAGLIVCYGLYLIIG
jgi:hypothetical protein